MSFSVAPGAGTTAGRRARRAWIALHVDAGQSIVLAGSALMLVLALARPTGDLAGEAWARVTRGFHGLFFAAPEQARAQLALAIRCFEATGDRSG